MPFESQESCPENATHYAKVHSFCASSEPQHDFYGFVNACPKMLLHNATTECITTGKSLHLTRKQETNYETFPSIHILYMQSNVKITLSFFYEPVSFYHPLAQKINTLYFIQYNIDMLNNFN